MDLLTKIKILLEKINNYSIETEENETLEIIEIKQPEKPLPPLDVYEARKQEIEDSSERIEGVFYIREGVVIPDYFSECLVSEKSHCLRKEMYHIKFYKNYMQRKFADLSHSYDEKSAPRGRIINNAIFIDTCYLQDKKIISELIKIYRLCEKNVTVAGSDDYVCPKCQYTFKKVIQ